MAIDAFEALVDVLSPSLSKDEEALFRSALHEMRMGFVRASGSKEGAAAGPGEGESPETGPEKTEDQGPEDAGDDGAEGVEAGAAEGAEGGAPAASEGAEEGETHDEG